MINERLENQIKDCYWNEALTGGMFINGKLTLYASVSHHRRHGIFKYTFTPHSYSEKRLSPFCLAGYGENLGNNPVTQGKKYHFVFGDDRTNERLCFDADTIEDLGDQIDTISSHFDDMIICLSKFCPDVPLKGTNVKSPDPESEAGSESI
jgi:hypothetical protein